MNCGTDRLFPCGDEGGSDSDCQIDPSVVVLCRTREIDLNTVVVVVAALRYIRLHNQDSIRF